MGALIARFLPSLLPGLQAFMNPWVILILLAIAAAGFTAGWKVESWRWDAANAVMLEANIKAVKEFWDRQRGINAAISAALGRDRAQLDSDRNDFQEALNAAKRKGPILKAQCPQPPGAPAVAGSGLAAAPPDGVAAGVLCDRDCVVLWHRGLAQGLPGAYGAWRADADALGPDSVAGDDLLSNAGANFAAANACRSQVIGWQRWARENGLTP